MTANIKVEEISIQDLVKEALSIPNGWKEEIFVEDGEVSFSGPETHNTYTAINPHEPLAIADLESISIGDFEGFYLREDGKVEIADYTGQFKEKGEYYEHAEIVEYDEAVERIAFNLENTQSSLNDLLKTIKQSQEKMKCKNCGKEIDETEANEYYFKGKVIEAKDIDMYGTLVTVICQNCL